MKVTQTTNIKPKQIDAGAACLAEAGMIYRTTRKRFGMLTQGCPMCGNLVCYTVNRGELTTFCDDECGFELIYRVLPKLDYTKKQMNEKLIETNWCRCDRLAMDIYCVTCMQGKETISRDKVTAQTMIGAVLGWVVNNETPKQQAKKYGKAIRIGKHQIRRQIKRAKSDSEELFRRG